MGSWSREELAEGVNKNIETLKEEFDFEVDEKMFRQELHDRLLESGIADEELLKSLIEDNNQPSEKNDN